MSTASMEPQAFSVCSDNSLLGAGTRGSFLIFHGRPFYFRAFQVAWGSLNGQRWPDCSSPSSALGSIACHMPLPSAGGKGHPTQPLASQAPPHTPGLGRKCFLSSQRLTGAALSSWNAPTSQRQQFTK